MAGILIGFILGTNALTGTMELLATAFKASFTPLVGALFIFFIAASMLDVATGVIKAVLSGDFTSSQMRKGLWKKIANLGIVVLTIMVNGVFAILGLNAGVWLMIAVLVPLFALEIGSILENLGESGVVIPKSLRKALKVLREKDKFPEGDK